jgi:hypothetical protein
MIRAVTLPKKLAGGRPPCLRLDETRQGTTLSVGWASQHFFISSAETPEPFTKALLPNCPAKLKPPELAGRQQCRQHCIFGNVELRDPRNGNRD